MLNDLKIHGIHDFQAWRVCTYMAFFAVSAIVMFFAVVHTKAVIKTMNSTALNLTELLKSKGIDGPAGILVVLAIIGLSLAFLWWFFLPAVFGWIEFIKIGAGLKELSARPTPNDLEKVFSSDERLREQWAQYSESLHLQHQEKNGMMQASAWRATLPAEVFLTLKILWMVD